MDLCRLDHSEGNVVFAKGVRHEILLGPIHSKDCSSDPTPVPVEKKKEVYYVVLCHYELHYVSFFSFRKIVRDGTGE